MIYVYRYYLYNDILLYICIYNSCINHTKRLYIFAININVFLLILSYINYIYTQ